MTPQEEIAWLKQQFPEVEAEETGERLVSGENYARLPSPIWSGDLIRTHRLNLKPGDLKDFFTRNFPDRARERFSDALSAINETRLTGEDPDMVPFAVYDKLRDDYEAVMREKRKLEIGFGLAVIGAISGWGALAFVVALIMGGR